jgi:cytochrome c oxidase cbb3-type subunit III
MRHFPTLLLLTAACAWAQTNAEQGRHLFQQSCAFCHGTDATGAEGPSLILSSVVRHDKEGDLIGSVIRNGRPEKGMPPIPLSPEQTASLVAFLHARVAESDRRSAGKPNAGYTLERLNTGNAPAGKAFFTAHCAQCHAPAGDLRGIGKKYPPVDLQTRLLYPSGVAQTAIVRTRSGEVFKGAVVYADPFTLAMRCEDGWYRSWNPAAIHADIADPLTGHRELLKEYSEADLHNVFSYLETLQ